MLDDDRRLFVINDKIIKLTKNETKLMQVLIKNKGKWTSTEDLVKLVDCNSTNALHKLISKLNDKIKKQYHIKNNRTKGYRIITIYND